MSHPPSQGDLTFSCLKDSQVSRFPEFRVFFRTNLTFKFIRVRVPPKEYCSVWLLMDKME